MAVIVACAVLHNIALNYGDVTDFDDIEVIQSDEYIQEEIQSQGVAGSVFRQAIINRYF